MLRDRVVEFAALVLMGRCCCHYRLRKNFGLSELLLVATR
jgi:hypothetical protein